MSESGRLLCSMDLVSVKMCVRSFKPLSVAASLEVVIAEIHLTKMVASSPKTYLLIIIIIILSKDLTK